jgi:hypothetical protein
MSTFPPFTTDLTIYEQDFLGFSFDTACAPPGRLIVATLPIDPLKDEHSLTDSPAAQWLR